MFVLIFYFFSYLSYSLSIYFICCLLYSPFVSLIYFFFILFICYLFILFIYFVCYLFVAWPDNNCIFFFPFFVFLKDDFSLWSAAISVSYQTFAGSTYLSTHVCRIMFWSVSVLFSYFRCLCDKVCFSRMSSTSLL